MSKLVPFSKLKGETITEVKFGSVEAPKLGPYGAYTLITSSGKTFTITQCLGEPQLCEIVPSSNGG
jgi:hypothetical protein